MLKFKVGSLLNPLWDGGHPCLIIKMKKNKRWLDPTFMHVHAAWSSSHHLTWQPSHAISPMVHQGCHWAISEFPGKVYNVLNHHLVWGFYSRNEVQEARHFYVYCSLGLVSTLTKKKKLISKNEFIFFILELYISHNLL
jgi:hypothetical protein